MRTIAEGIHRARLREQHGMVASCAYLLNPILEEGWHHSKFFTLHHMREAGDGNLSCLVGLVGDAGLWSARVAKVAYASLSISAIAPSVKIAIGSERERVIPTCCNHCDFFVCEKVNQVRSLIHLSISVA